MILDSRTLRTTSPDQVSRQARSSWARKRRKIQLVSRWLS